MRSPWVACPFLALAQAVWRHGRGGCPGADGATGLVGSLHASWDRACGGSVLPCAHQLGYDPRLHQPAEILIRQAHEFRMRAGVEGNLLVFGQTLCDKHLEPVEIAKGRHRPHLAVGKEIAKPPLAGELSL